ncbi:MAG TPA: DNA polymerase III subunit gamma/tau, partial [Candidatus Syntrophosphaera sp.]|nr:DNA polymerase III subunit gamma/tau [Candidatus Syntrophosphaera sp.]
RYKSHPKRDSPRCQRYDFKRIPIDSIVRRLQELTQAEAIEIDNESLHLIARKAEGSLRDALSLLDQVLSYSLNQVTIVKVREIFGVIPTQIYCDLLRLIRNRDGAALLTELQRVFEHGTDLQELVNSMMEFLRLVILRQLGMAPSELTTGEHPAYDEIAGLYSQSELLYIQSYLLQARGELRGSGNPYLILEMLMIKLCKLDEMQDIAELITKLDKLNTGQIPPTPSKTPQPAARKIPERQASPERAPEADTPAKMAFTQENLDQIWDRFCARIKAVSKGSGVALEKAQYAIGEYNKLLIKVNGSTHLSLLQSGKDNMQQLLAEYFSEPVRLEMSLLEGAAPVQVEIVRKNLEDLKQADPNLARFIEVTESQLSLNN